MLFGNPLGQVVRNHRSLPTSPTALPDILEISPPSPSTTSLPTTYLPATHILPFGFACLNKQRSRWLRPELILFFFFFFFLILLFRLNILFFYLLFFFLFSFSPLFVFLCSALFTFYFPLKIPGWPHRPTRPLGVAHLRSAWMH